MTEGRPARATNPIEAQARGGREAVPPAGRFQQSRGQVEIMRLESTECNERVTGVTVGIGGTVLSVSDKIEDDHLSDRGASESFPASRGASSR
jgi:hypothetical protein